MPISKPEMVEYGFAVSPGAETFVAVSPEAIIGDEAIYKFDHQKRQCYLNSERQLRFFRHYSFLNCFRECATNHTFQVRCTLCFILDRTASIISMYLIGSSTFYYNHATYRDRLKAQFPPSTPACVVFPVNPFSAAAA